MDSVRSHTADEIIQMMKKTPLFMTDLDEAAGGADGEDNEDNVELEALRALQYEGTRAEVALGFKERGNEMVAEKRWGDAKVFYTKAIAALNQVSEAKESGASTLSFEGRGKEIEEEKKIEEACYVNRALCNLELKNYRSTLTDTSHTLTLSPTNTKAHYRSTLALFSLGKHDLALDTCTRGLTLTSSTIISTNIAMKPSAEHLAFQKLKARIEKAKAEQEGKESRRTNEEERRKKEQLTLNAAITARGIKVKMTAKQPPDMEDARIHLEPDPVSPTSQLHFPVLVLYPTLSQSDLVKSVAETETFGNLLETVVGEPLPWDEAGEFRLDGEGVECFMETPTGGMIKVGKKMRLLDVLAKGKVEVVDGVVRVFVVPNGRVEGWVESMKARKPSP
ncbi:MAG: hypothetical protein Q9166_004290 [cf. Caloplaca sp. 2 TL-2023]